MKLLKIIMAVLLVTVMTACNGREAVNIEELRIEYSPMTGSDEIFSMTLDLGMAIKRAMAEKGVNIEKVTVTVAASFDDAALALIENRSDIAWLSAVTYCQYSDKLEVLAAGTKKDISTEKLTELNGDNPLSDKATVAFRSLIITSNNDLRRKAENGEKIEWKDLENLTWAITDSRYSIDSFMPLALWLKDDFGKNMRDIKYIRVPAAGRIGTIQNGEADITVIRVSEAANMEEWGKGWGVIGLTKEFANDPICFSGSNEMLKNRRVRKALLEVLEELTEMYRYGYEGIAEVKESQYRDMKKALNIINELN